MLAAAQFIGNYAIVYYTIMHNMLFWVTVFAVALGMEYLHQHIPSTTAERCQLFPSYPISHWLVCGTTCLTVAALPIDITIDSQYSTW